MDGGAHERQPDHEAVRHEARQRLGIEVRDPRPQPEVGIARQLGLHAHEVSEHVGETLAAPRRGGSSLEQALPGQQGATERSPTKPH